MAAAHAAALWEAARPRLRPALLGLGIALLSAWFLGTRIASLHVPANSAWRYVVGRQPVQDVYAMLSYYPALRFVATQLGPEPRVFDATAGGHRLYAFPAKLFTVNRTPLLRKYWFDGVFQDLVRVMREQHLDYLLMSAQMMENDPFRSFAEEQCVPLFGRNGYFVYRLLPEGVENPLPIPVITALAPAQGPTGTRVIVTGRNLSHAVGVAFGGRATVNYTIDSPSQITAAVPPDGLTGMVGLATHFGTATSNTVFTVTSEPNTAATERPGAGFAGDARVVQAAAGHAASWQQRVDGDELHLLAMQVRSQAGVRQTARLSVEWLDEDGRMLGEEGFPLFAPNYWGHRVFPVTPLAGARQARIRITPADGPLWIHDLRYERFSKDPQQLPYYPALRFLATRLGPEPRVFDATSSAFGLYAYAAKLCTLHRTPSLQKYWYDGSFDDLARVLREQRIDYLLMNAPILQNESFGPFVERHCVPLFGRNSYFVYRLLPEGVQNPLPVPVITGLAPAQGPPGTRVIVTGRNLSHAVAVAFGCRATVDYTVDSPGQITAVVPPNGLTGIVGVATHFGTAISNTVFAVTSEPATAANGHPGASSAGDPRVVQATAGDGASWQHRVEGDELHLLAMQVRSQTGVRQSAVVSVAWLDEDGRMLGEEEFPLFPGDYWRRRVFPVTPLAGARQARIRITPAEGALWIHDLRCERFSEEPQSIASHAAE
jgi:hypothetical protein